MISFVTISLLAFRKFKLLDHIICIKSMKEIKEFNEFNEYRKSNIKWVIGNNISLSILHSLSTSTPAQTKLFKY